MEEKIELASAPAANDGVCVEVIQRGRGPVYFRLVPFEAAELVAYIPGAWRLYRAQGCHTLLTEEWTGGRSAYDGDVEMYSAARNRAEHLLSPARVAELAAEAEATGRDAASYASIVEEQEMAGD